MIKKKQLTEANIKQKTPYRRFQYWVQLLDIKKLNKSSESQSGSTSIADNYKNC